VAFASNPAFDATTMEVWGALLNGGAIVVIDQPVLLDPQALAQALDHHRVSVLLMTAGLFSHYAQDLSAAFGNLRYLILGGDVLDPAAVLRLLRRHAPQHLLNGYGPTEATTLALTHEIVNIAEGARSIALGRPNANTRVYILDGQGQPVPIGVCGEIYIGGAGVALGYWNRPELTAERFVTDPFVRQTDARLYKTGDLGKWLPDGTVEFLGRNDCQVKIRGFRVELGEIEARLAEYPSVCDAVVIAREDVPGDKRLVTYYTASVALQADALRAHLAHSLPEYMVPAAYVHLEALPLTSYGKLDRLALPAAAPVAYAGRGQEAPEGELETTLATIWSQILKVDRIGRNDDFFVLGGHSLLSVQVARRLAQAGFPVSITDLFRHPTVAGLAELLVRRRQENAVDQALLVQPGRGEPPLFFVHDGKGELLYAHMLAPHLNAEIPIYGLPLDPSGKLDAIEAMAARMIRLMRAVQSVGPFRLAGWSAGGILAYEIAAQLIGQGDAVGFLGMLDTTWVEGSSYRARPLPIPVHLFTAADEHPGDPRLGWTSVLPEALIRLSLVGGTHHSMLQAPHIAPLGRSLNAAIGSTSGGSRPMKGNRQLSPDRGFNTPFGRTTLEELRQVMTDEEELAAHVERIHLDANVVDLKRGEYYPELLRAKMGLRAAVASALQIEPIQVLPNFGSNGSIDTILTVAKILETHESAERRPASVLMTSPTYFRYYDSASSRQLEVHEVPLTEDHQLDVNAYIAAMKRLRPSVAIIVTPNNPTGIAISDADLLTVLDAVPAGTWAMVDRTLVNTRPEISTQALLQRYRDRDLVVLHSFSKYKSMSQHRIGVALFSNVPFARLIDPLLPLGLSLEACVKATSIVLAEGGLVPSQAVIHNIEDNQRVLAAFVRDNPRYQVTDFSGNYCLLTLPAGLSAEMVTEELARMGLHVMGGHEFPRPNPRVLRLHTGGEATKMARLCALLRDMG
jgi:histidinol-phosphate/aromatic aminotransferase/cobyric acid decarboxylase-like protein/thioesterase domain-containing protein